MHYKAIFLNLILEGKNMENHKIYQIFYNSITKISKDPGFIDMDNTLNLRPDWSEYWPIRNFLSKETLNSNYYYGFFSPKFKEKTGLDSSAVQDILTTLKRRSPLSEILLRPTLVQGDSAIEDIKNAIIELQSHNCDIIILARGGGSIEDLWAFNSELVARTIANCSIPIIAGIGHETDFTIADFVADHRAATPTAAAELATSITISDFIQFIDKNLVVY